MTSVFVYIEKLTLAKFHQANKLTSSCSDTAWKERREHALRNDERRAIDQIVVCGSNSASCIMYELPIPFILRTVHFSGCNVRISMLSRHIQKYTCPFISIFKVAFYCCTCYCAVLKFFQPLISMQRERKSRASATIRVLWRYQVEMIIRIIQKLHTSWNEFSLLLRMNTVLITRENFHFISRIESNS